MKVKLLPPYIVPAIRFWFQYSIGFQNRFSFVYAQVVRKIWVLRLFLWSMLRVQEVHQLVINLNLCLYSCSTENYQSRIMLTAIQRACQLLKRFFLNIFPRNYVPKRREGVLGTMQGLQRLRWEESGYELCPTRHQTGISTGLWGNMDKAYL